MEELYERQQSIKLRPIHSAIVVGLGGTGSWVGLLLALSGCPQLDLFDFDYLQPSNFNRLPLSPVTDVGRSKVEAMAELINHVRPDCQVGQFGEATGFTLLEVNGSPGDPLFDCTDRLSTQTFLSSWCRSNDRAYVRCGYDGSHMSVLDQLPSWSTGAPALTGYEITPSWVIPPVIAACAAIAKVTYNPAISLSCDLNELFVPRRSHG